MSRDSRLIRTHLLELREHEVGRHELITHAAEGVHRELQARRDTRPAPEVPEVQLQLPERADAPVGD